MTPSGIEPATFQLVAQYLKYLRHLVCLTYDPFYQKTACCMITAWVQVKKDNRGLNQTYTAVVYNGTKLFRHRFAEESKNGKLVPAHAVKAYGETGGMAPPILNLGARCRCVIDFTARPF
jgi:hypothetical protein